MCISLLDQYSPTIWGESGDNPTILESIWTEMKNLDYVISKAIFSDFAKFGSFIINGDWMISQHGTLGGVDYGSNNILVYKGNIERT